MLIGYALHLEQPDIGVYYYAVELEDALYDGNIQKSFMPEGGLPFTYTPFTAALFRLMGVIPSRYSPSLGRA